MSAPLLLSTSPLTASMLPAALLPSCPADLWPTALRRLFSAGGRAGRAGRRVSGGRRVPGSIIVSDTGRRCLSTSSTQTLTISPTETTSCGSCMYLIGQLADMHQPAVLEPYIDERAEVDHVQHGAGQFHAAGQVVEFQDALS